MMSICRSYAITRSHHYDYSVCSMHIITNRMRNQAMGGGGGYNSQQGYQARPPTNWSQPGGPPMQQPGYGYVQPGAYPAPQQYNPNYTNYPPTYTSGWDPSQNPQTAPGGGSNYDYYSQQQQTHGGPADNYPQGGQDSYGGYQSGYGQPTTNPSGGYEQQQKPGGYNSTYGNPPADGSETSQPPAQPSPNPNYPYGSQVASGYGGAQAQKPSYGQLPGYPPPPQPAQTGYVQTDAGAQRPPASGYPQSSQVGYGGAMAYGGGYAQQPYSQQAPPPPAYSTDVAQPAAGSVKTSPPS
ncbi:Far upstream element-binding protein [Striga asiatica]|uniref:Far upstream element-binding protein n=1 Tax=Striga asiatica TaxID=4170 RepID=A0A5A7PMB4_STRAF|nr:Far upstream element-binding protein [Striga asiatica]